MGMGNRAPVNRSPVNPAAHGEVRTRLVAAPMLPGCAASIIIPAKDEADGIVATLGALVGQTDPLG
ncbi:MAG TPA: hypothetical protein VIL85_05900 [Thermomicrobiales bacterium]